MVIEIELKKLNNFNIKAFQLIALCFPKKFSRHPVELQLIIKSISRLSTDYIKRKLNLHFRKHNHLMFTEN
jgi:hypothetical protein